MVNSNWAPTKTEPDSTHISLGVVKNNAIILEQLSSGIYLMRRIFKNAKGRTVVAGKTFFASDDVDNAKTSFLVWVKKFLATDRLIDGSTFNKDVFHY